MLGGFEMAEKFCLGEECAITGKARHDDTGRICHSTVCANNDSDESMEVGGTIRTEGCTAEVIPAHHLQRTKLPTVRQCPRSLPPVSVLRSPSSADPAQDDSLK